MTPSSAQRPSGDHSMLSVDRRPRPTSARNALGQMLGHHWGSQLPTPEDVAVLAADPFRLSSIPCLARKPKGMPFSDWILDSLVRCRGVMAALPRAVWPASVAEADSAAGRIVTLDGSAAVGRAWWWLWKLRTSEYISKTAYASDDWTCVYQTDGLEADGNTWLPSASDYDSLVLSSGFDRITCAGFAVTVRFVPPPLGGESGSLDKLPHLNQRILLELEAASNGTGPAILALTTVSTGDDFLSYEARAVGMAADRDVSDEPRQSSLPGPVAACVTVSQTHSFRLSDMLGAYNKVMGDPLLRPSLTALNGSVYEMTAAIARKVRVLAQSRILKLNMVPDTVVFCPRLCENDATGELEAQGYGYEGMEAVKGLPYMWDFDPVYTKRVTSQTPDYDPDCAYLTMMLMLLASVRAQYGEVVSRVMTNKVIGRSPDGAALGSEDLPEGFDQIDMMAAGRRSREKATLFCVVLRGVLPTFAKDHEPTLGAAYAEVAKDFQDIVRSEILEHWGSTGDMGTFDRTRSIFRNLVRYLSGSSAADSAVFTPPAAGAEAVLERERAHRVEERLKAVRIARLHRLASKPLYLNSPKRR